MLKRFLFRHSWIAFVVCAALGGATTLYAIDTSSALYTSNIQLLNLGLTRANFAAATEISGSALIDDAFMEPDTLNAVVHEGPVEIPSMPPNNRIVVEGSVVDDGGSFTEFTTEARDDTELDVALLPVTPEVGDAHYFGCDNPCRIITVDIGQEAIADTLEVEWEYWNGTAFVTSSNVNDATNAFTLAGQRTVSFDMPRDFATRTITGSAVDAFWVRARVTDVDSPTQQAIGNQMWYENGQWWSWVRSQAINDEILYNLSLGGPDLVANHQIFPGDAGVITPDDASAELGDRYAIHFEGALNFGQGASGSDICIVCKAGALRLFISDTTTNELTLSVTGSSTTTLVVDGVPNVSTSIAPHEIDVVSDGTDLTFSVANAGVATGAAQAVVDNANDWEWISNGAATFANQLYILPDETALATESFDTFSEWDSGAQDGTDALSGQPVAQTDAWGQPTYLHSFYPEADSDDGFWREGDNSFVNSATDIVFGNTSSAGGQHNSFIRVQNVNIEQGATIDEASLFFSVTSLQNQSTVRVDISAIDEDDASAPGDAATAEAATRTSAVVNWDPVPDFEVVTSGGTFNQSPDITSVIQEVIDRPGWQAGNSLVIMIDDTGSSTTTAGIFRRPAAYEDDFPSVILRVREAEPDSITDDFIAAENQISLDEPDIPGWVTTSAPTGAINSLEIDRAFHGRQAIKMKGGNGNFAILQRDIPATAGETWSFSARYSMIDESGNEERLVEINWLDSDGIGISTDTTILTNVLDGTYTANGLVAPAGTASANIEFVHDCTGTPCGTAETNFDSVLACEAATAPPFGDPCNVVVNPSFETEYPAAPTWISPTINLTQDNVDSSEISWEAITPKSTSLTVETSIDGQSTWQTATNNGSIPGISPGDDVSGDTLHIRVTPNTDALNIHNFTPFVGTLSIFIGDDVPEDDAILFYELRTTPGVTIEDLSPNSNDGTMSYPVQFAGIFSAITPLRSNRTPISREAALGVGDFAGSAPVTGSDSLNLFGQDDGTFIPGAQPIVDAMNDLGAPVAFFWVMLISAIGIGFGAMVWKGTNGNEMAVSLVLGATLVLAAAMGDGLIPGWVPIVSIMMLVAWNILRSRLPI